MLSHWPIRYKLLLGIAMLFLIVAILAFSSFRGVYAYRQLVRGISHRAAELPLAAELTRSVGDLRFSFSRARPTRDFRSGMRYDLVDLREEFRTRLLAVHEALSRYQQQLEQVDVADNRIGDSRREQETVRRIERALNRIAQVNRDEDWVLDQVQVDALDEALEELYSLSGQLPSYLQRRMHDLQGQVRTEYRTWIVLTWISSILSVAMLLLLVRFFYTWVFRPLRVLIRASRRVAGGQFDHRVRLNTHDEMAELAGAMNAMTSRFQEIRDDLDRQVQQRTKEVVRSEQLASVGFLAAGVAHEINNPLASIAWCAESLETRLHDILYPEDTLPEPEQDTELAVLRKYLCRIQEEAFRCKGITEKLLDFSRMGDVPKQPADLRQLVQDVIDMVQHLGKYRQKHIDFLGHEPVMAAINAQEIKQVVLNLITNALDSIEPQGRVTVELHQRQGQAELLVSDNGVGMTEEVLEHLFEPFFTRRRSGQGTGLGLSITFRIVSGHGGTIEAHSEGPQCGSQLRVILPLEHHEETHQKQHQFA